MDGGWVPFHRTFNTDGHLDRMADSALRLYVLFRLEAQWCPGRGLQVGQVRTSYRKLRTKTGYAMQTISKALTHLRSAGLITTEQFDAGGPLVVTVCDMGAEEPASPSEAPASLSEAPASPRETGREGGASPSEAGVLPPVKQGASPSEAPTESDPLSHKASGDPQEGNKKGIHKKDTLVSQSDKPPGKQPSTRKVKQAESKEQTPANELASDAYYIAKVYDELANKAGLDSIADWKEANGIVQKQLKRAGAPRITREEAEQAIRWAFQDRRAQVGKRGLTGIRDFWSWWLDVKNRTSSHGKGYQLHYTPKSESSHPSGFLRKERQAT